MGLIRFLIRRSILAIATIFIVALITFFIIRLAPGDPASLLAGEGASPQFISIIRKEYGLDQPVQIQLAIYLANLLQGNLGYSITYSRPVINVIMERLPQTVELVGTSIILSIAIGMILGILAATRAGSIRDKVINIVVLTLYSIPVFWLGLALIFAFSLYLPLFPTGGFLSIGSSRNLFSLIIDALWHLFLPALTLTTFNLAIYARLTRAGLIEALGMNYIFQARAKGLEERDIIYKHALRNALLPIVTVASIQIGLLVSGVVLTESIFSWPGVGSLLVQAVFARDYPLVTGIFVITGVAVALSNLAADIIYAIIDPRIRTG